ncbi:hypothetical protein [Streptomyces sp. NPDC054794]
MPSNFPRSAGNWTHAQQLSSPELPPEEQRLRGAAHVVADSWPYDNPLGAAVLEAEQLYLRA